MYNMENKVMFEFFLKHVINKIELQEINLEKSCRNSIYKNNLSFFKVVNTV